MSSVMPLISLDPLLAPAAVLRERALVLQVAELGALAEQRRIANQELAGQLRDLFTAKADADRALAERGVALEKANRDLDQFTYAAPPPGLWRALLALVNAPTAETLPRAA